MKTNTFKIAVLASALLLGAASGAFAAVGTATLTINDGINPVIVDLDNNLGGTDIRSEAGAVGWSGSVGVWSIVVTVGQTYPVAGFGDPSSPDMDINVVATSSRAGSLTIWFSNVGYLQHGTAVATIGGTSSAFGSLVYTTYADTSVGGTLINGTAQTLTSQTFSASPYSGTVIGPVVSGTGAYSLSQKVVITHVGSGVTSLDATLNVPDGGATVVLLGSSLLALVGFARARKNA